MKETAGRMQATLSPYDRLGRYGGEEFLIIVSGCDSSQAIALAERIRCAIEEEAFPGIAGGIAMTLSLGVAFRDCKHGDIEILIAAADKALYQAKNGGRNRVEYTF